MVFLVIKSKKAVKTPFFHQIKPYLIQQNRQNFITLRKTNFHEKDTRFYKKQSTKIFRRTF